MKEITKQYDPVTLNNIRKMLKDKHEWGSPQYYEIWVDELKVVEKTNDPDRFDLHEKYLNDLTEKATINLFSATESSAHIVTRYNLLFEEEPKKETNTMNGLGLGEIEAKINEKVSIERERWDCDQVKKDLISLKEKLKESEEWNEKLEVIIEETKKKLEEAKGMSDFTNIIKDLALSKFLGKKPEEKQSLAGNEKPQEEASFKMKSSQENSISETDKNFLAFGKSLQENFSKEEFDMVLSIIDEFMKDKTNIKPVQELLNIKPNEQTKK
jgi:hypothetical protein